MTALAFSDVAAAEAAGFCLLVPTVPDYRGFAILLSNRGGAMHCRIRSRSGVPTYTRVHVPEVIAALSESAMVASIENAPPAMRIKFRFLRYDGPLPRRHRVRLGVAADYYPNHPFDRNETRIHMWRRSEVEALALRCRSVIDRHLGPPARPRTAATESFINDELPI